ncbi:MAG: hypothetical protein OXI56_04730 [bacterium]|nr:hypothetical protein [bacterium]MDE0601083.1 hypothetical protein [bacterium]
MAETQANVRIGLPNFVRDVYYLPDRALDLLELAAFVYCADRMKSRGSKRAVEYHAWARSFHFVVKVRDHAFWSRKEVADCLSEALRFMTGDREYRFSFEPGHSTSKTSLFDDEQFSLGNACDTTVALFSGGLDSLAGVLDHLENTTDQLCLVSHQSQPGTVRTQRQLVMALDKHYPGRVFHYKFQCNLRGIRAAEESQRSRAFLYTSIAFTIALAFGQNNVTIFENGITSLNFPRRADLIGARASRTTHPKAIHLLNGFFSLLLGDTTKMHLPFLWKTKTDIMASLKVGAHPELISSSVSCSRTFQNLGTATHCGGCSQCVDRRFAAYGSKTEKIDHPGIYAHDIIGTSIPDREVRTTVVDYVRQARDFSIWSEDHFFQEMATELSEIVDYLPGGGGEFQRLELIRELCRRHGEQVFFAMKRIKETHDNLYVTVAPDSLLDVIHGRDYLKDPVSLLVDRICELVGPAIGKMFGRNPPKDEPDLNVKISGLLDSHRIDLRREHPAVSFAGGYAVPDHGSDSSDVLIEAKYLRGGTTPSKASEGMAADLTKYSQDKHILFVVYDPQRAVRDDQIFKDDFEARGRCTVLLVR